MKHTENTGRIGPRDDIFNQMIPEDLLVHRNSLNASVPSPEDILITIEEGRGNIEDTLYN